MQRVIGLLLVLLAIGWLASRMPAMPDNQQPPATPSWRRTCDGWQRADRLHGVASRDEPLLHPVVFGAGLLVFALTALVGLSPDENNAAKERFDLAGAARQ